MQWDGSDTSVVPSNSVIDKGLGSAREGEIWGSEPPVRSDAANRQITLAIVVTNSRSCWSSFAVCQSAEVDRSALSSEQFWSSVFCCCGPVDLEFAARQSSQSSTEPQHL